MHLEDKCEICLRMLQLQIEVAVFMNMCMIFILMTS